MKLKGIVLAVILSLASIMMPFSVYAETVGGTSPIIGVNIKYLDYEMDREANQYTVSFDNEQTRWQCMSSHSTMGCQVWQSQTSNGTIQDEITGTINASMSTTESYAYEYEFILDKAYVGYITFSEYIGATTTKTFYVNGTSFTVTSPTFRTSFTVTSYNLEYAPLETINIMKQWNIPVESFNIVNYFLHTFELNNPGTYYYNYPLFNVPSNTPFIVSRRLNRIGAESYLIIGINKNTWDLASFNNYVSQLENVEISNYERINIQDSPFNDQFGIVKLTIRNTSSVTGTLRTMSFNTDMVILPIYNQEVSLRYISTDFALRYGLRNEILDNLQIIANGTNQSNSAASNLESGNNQMADDMNDLATIENGYNQQFNNQLQQIDFTSPLQNNAGILPAANFVITIFNGLINNNPFSVLIIVVCILLIGKKVIGK